MGQDEAVLLEGLQRAADLMNAGDVSAAVDALDGIWQQEEPSPSACHIMGLIAFRLGQTSRALDLLQKAHDLAPNTQQHAEVLAIIHAQLGRMNDALYFGKLATVLEPNPDIRGMLPGWLGSFEKSFAAMQEARFFEKGMQCFRKGQLGKAIEFYQKEAELQPKDGRSWRMLARVLQIRNRPVERLLILQALEDAKDFGRGDYGVVASGLADVGRFQDSLEMHRNSLENGQHTSSELALYIHDALRAPQPDLDHISELIELWGKGHEAPFQANRPPSDTDWHRVAPLRVGVLSGRFRDAGGLDLLWPLLMGANSQTIAFYCYSSNPFDDAMTRRIAGSVEQFVDISDVDDKTSATIIRNDGLHVLLDLDGWSPDGRPGVVGYRPVATTLRYNDVPNLSAAAGVTASIAGEGALGGDEEAQCSVSKGLFAFPKDAPVHKRPVSSRGTLKVGWAPQLHQVGPERLETVNAILNASPDVELVLHTQALGGVNGLDIAEPHLEQAGLQGRVAFAEPDEDPAVAREAFLSGIDVLLDVEGSVEQQDFLESMLATLPVLTIPGLLPGQCNTAHVLEALGLSECVCRHADEAARRIGEWQSDRNIFEALRDKQYALVKQETDVSAIRLHLSQLEAALRAILAGQAAAPDRKGEA